MIAVAERIVHERYRPSAKYDDIALLRLQSPARMTGHVRPACLHTEPALRADTDNTNSPIVTGWGFTKEEGVGSDHLLKVAVNVVENDACRAYYESATDDRMRDGIRADSQVCAGGAGRDSCSGDSGGPLQYGPSPSGPYCMYRVAGVVSFGPGLCGMGFPGVYTRVYHYLPWIENIVWPERRPAPAEATPPTAPLVSSQPSGLGWERPAGVHGDRRQPVEDVDSNGAADVTTQGRPRPPHKPEPAGDQGARPQPVMDVDSNDTSEMATQRRPRPPHKPQNAGVQSGRRQPVVDVDRSGTADMAGRGTPRPEHRVTTKWRQSELKLKYKLAGDSSSPVERGWSSGAAQHELSFWSIFAASLCTLYLIA
ncbi:hypothetical protein ONE63_004490 [Megalurothrips usitatus]|uniref:Peptidase S1 domain-containing protein n=1 Tax=Megalurothrips usitatus TaxID=439358 RepID=A0AAV7X8L4_9NEOP|nr:hypothetical protein ONE63_004490 [Megalurothrips usitatus]